LAYDESIVIHYPLPRFFFTSPENKGAIQRVQEGIFLAYQDGSLLKLWQKYYQPSIEFSALKRRKVVELHNPLIETLDPAYKQYNFDPFAP
jgi:hypothetical protein